MARKSYWIHGGIFYRDKVVQVRQQATGWFAKIEVADKVEVTAGPAPTDRDAERLLADSLYEWIRDYDQKYGT